MLNQRILVVSWAFSRSGGIEEVSRQVLSALEESDRYIVKAYQMKKGRFGGFFSMLQLNWHCLMGWSLAIMHPYILQRYIWRMTHYFRRSKVIVWTHGIDAWGAFGRRLASKLPLADVVVAVSQYTKQRVLENFPEVCIKVVNNAIDESLAPVFEKDPSGFEVITVSRLAKNERYKGHDLVMQALKPLIEDGVSVRYNIVGKGDDEDRLKNIARDLGIFDCVVFHGYVPDKDVGRVFARSSVFVMPSRVIKRNYEIWGGEGFGLVYLEAGLHGLPVIACNEGGQTDCVVDGETGFLVNPESKEIADRIRFLYENQDTCRAMGERGRYYVKENFTFDIFSQNVHRVIEGVFDQGRYE